MATWWPGTPLWPVWVSVVPQNFLLASILIIISRFLQLKADVVPKTAGELGPGQSQVWAA